MLGPTVTYEDADTAGFSKTLINLHTAPGATELVAPATVGGPTMSSRSPSTMVRPVGGPTIGRRVAEWPDEPSVGDQHSQFFGILATMGGRLLTKVGGGPIALDLLA
ncbi:MAG: hypothetical protein OEY55_06885 [Acidimicrobiia bacterium]|nr:hypothetical protein [Acidimicrobiia bacterium]MDH5504164.1 hypothetical protein [Acidimicrobiia bacterium]